MTCPGPTEVTQSIPYSQLYEDLTLIDKQHYFYNNLMVAQGTLIDCGKSVNGKGMNTRRQRSLRDILEGGYNRRQVTLRLAIIRSQILLC